MDFKNILLFSLVFMATGCLIAEKERIRGNCGGKHYFDSQARDCLGAQVAAGPPIPTLQGLSFEEDSGRHTVVLDYVDSEGDLALACQVSSKHPGFIREKIIDGIRLRTKSYDAFGYNIAIEYIDNRGSATRVIADDSGANRIVQVYYQSTPTPTTGAHIVSLLQADYKTREWLDASLANGDLPVSGAFSQDFFDDLPCSCIAGLCNTVLHPVDDWSGNTGFSYTLSDRQGTSLPLEVPVDITHVNDPPYADNGLLTIMEDNIYVGHLLRDGIANAYDAKTLETPVQGLAFISRSAFPVEIEMVSDRTLNVTEIGGTITVTLPSGTTTDQVKTELEAHPSAGQLIFIRNNDPGGTLQAHPKTLLRTSLFPTDGDNDISGRNLTFEVIEGPRYGSLQDQGDGKVITDGGDFAYTPNPDYNSQLPDLGTDSFTYRVQDHQGSYSQTATVTINVTPVDDIPKATLSALTLPPLFEDALNVHIGTLTWAHPDADTADDVETCTLFPPRNTFYPVSTCTSTPTGVSVGTLGININMWPNASGEYTFSYFATDNDDPANSTLQTVSFTIQEVDDQPYGGYTSQGRVIALNESPTPIPDPPISFILDSLAHPDDNVTQSYQLVEPPRNGRLTDCMGLNHSSNQDLSCRYVPNDGNLSGVGTRASVTVDSNLEFKAKGAGVFGNETDIDLIAVPNFDLGQGVPPALAYVEYDTVDEHPIVRIVFNPATTTYDDIQSAVVNSRYFANQIIEVAGALGTGIYGGSSTLYRLAGGVNPIDYFVYRAIENNDDGDDTTVTVPIEITPTNDNPVVCEYTPFSLSNTVCGLSGCIGSVIPSQVVSSPPDGLYYYEQSAGVCWKSQGGNWEIIENHIQDKVFNELHPITVDTIKINEGGGRDEIGQELTLVSIDIHNEILIPPENIQFFYDQNDDGDFDDLGEALTPGASLNDGNLAAGDRPFRLVVVPVNGQYGISQVDVTFRDNFNASTTVSFNIIVYDNAAHHGGWRNISALGPRINRFDQNREAIKYVCPYSHSFCQTSTANYTSCVGINSPMGNADAIPLNPDAIYYNSHSGKCYRLRRVQIDGIDLVGKTSNTLFLEFLPGGTRGSETVSVTNRNITVTIEDGVSTSTDLKRAIEGHERANDLIKVENRLPTEALNVTQLTPIPALSNSNWETLTSSCHITSSDTDTSCRDAGLGDICVGFGNPNEINFNFTPNRRNTSYFDLANDKCYRSIETDGLGNDQDGDGNGQDWSEYKATGHVTLSWNKFLFVGDSRVSGYNVYRRVAGEEFNYLWPINRRVIPLGTKVVYEDNAKNSFDPPIPGSVYFYEVRPIINGIPTNTNEVFKTARVLAPPPNMAFVHRWIVNQSMCTLMNSEDIDTANHYRCPYEGPGDTGLAANNFYDFKRDLIVQRFESGCAYTAGCDTPDRQCIGIEEPNGEVSAPANSIYYSRSSGVCYVNTGTGNSHVWSKLNGNCDFHQSACNGNPCLGSTPPSVFAPRGTKYLDTANNRCYYNTGGSWINYSCPFDRANCNGTDDCYGNAGPNGTVLAPIGTLFYASSTNTCWQNTDGLRTWTDVTSERNRPYTDLTNLVGKMSRVELPPLVFVGQEESSSLCSRESIPEGDILGIQTNLTGNLPTRKEQVAYGMWQLEEHSSGVITGRERGLSLNSSAKCNTANADGLTEFFTDVDIPDSNTFFTLPGTHGSDIRSLMTGSYGENQSTEFCSSRYGIQDHIGNVEEWISDRVICPNGTWECHGVNPTNAQALSGTTSDFTPGLGGDPWNTWNLDGTLGPCVETGGGCDTFFNPWIFEEEFFSATLFSIPMGLPIDNDSNPYSTSPIDFTSSVVVPYFAEIGPTSGITPENLHNDGIHIQNRAVEDEATRCGGFVTGGSYTDGDDAGMWHFKIIPCTDRGDQTDDWTDLPESVKTGFRCLYRIDPENDYEE